MTAVLERVIRYSGVHAALRRTRGKASEYWCDSCDKRATQWAYIYDEHDEHHRQEDGRTFSLDLSRYLPMCHACHRAYDARRITHCPRGHAYTADNLMPTRSSRVCRERVCATSRALYWRKRAAA